MHKKTSLWILGGLFGATALSGAVLATPTTRGTTKATASNASVTVSSTCSMTATVNQAHSATISNGTSAENIGKTTLQTFCNDANGYAIYAVGYTGDTESTASAKTNILTSADLGPTYDIPSQLTNGSMILDGSVSNWGVKLTPVSGTYAPSIENGYNNYSVIPAQYTKVADLGSSTDAGGQSGSIGSSVEVTYKVSIAQAQPAGTYNGKVKYLLVHPSSAAAPDTYVMQDVAEWGSQLLVGEEVLAKDARDNKTYTVARLCVKQSKDCDSNDLANSQLWMTQNLDLVIGTTALDSTNTDINVIPSGTPNASEGYTETSGVITWAPYSTVMTPATITNFASGNPANSVEGWTNDYNRPYQAEGGDHNYMYGGGTYYSTLQACTSAGHTAAQCNHYHLGNYYNWTAAVAMSNTSGYNTDYTVMPNSICPKGWRLPNGLTSSTVDYNTQSDFNKLLYAQGIVAQPNLAADASTAITNSTKMFNQPLYFARSGSVNGSTLYSFTGYGYYWSSTVRSSSYAYSMGFNSGTVWPAGRYNRLGGWSLRCLAR